MSEQANLNQQNPETPGARFIDARDHDPVLAWNYAAKGWFRRRETSVVYGPSNAGKTAFVGHLGQCIVSNRPFFGARVTQGIVVHVAAESPASVLDRMQSHAIHDDTYPPYLVYDLPVDLSCAKSLNEFRRDLTQIMNDHGQEIVLVIFDTLSRCINGVDENSSTEMTAVVHNAEALARGISAHVMMIHHTGKDVERGGRGSSAIRGAVDTEICLKPGDAGAVALFQDKQRTMKKGKSVCFGLETHVLGLDEDGEEKTTVRAVERENDTTNAKKPTSKVRKGMDRTTAVLTALHIRRITGGNNASFQTNDILASIPPDVIETVKPEHRARVISRELENLSKQEVPLVESTGRGSWTFAPTVESQQEVLFNN